MRGLKGVVLAVILAVSVFAMFPLPNAEAANEIKNSNWRIKVANSYSSGMAIRAGDRWIDQSDYPCSPDYRVCAPSFFVVADLEVTNLGSSRRNLIDRYTNFRFSGHDGAAEYAANVDASVAMTAAANDRDFLSEGAEPGETYRLVLVAHLIDFDEENISAITMDLKNAESEIIRTFSLDLDFPKAPEQSIPFSPEPVQGGSGLAVQIVDAQLLNSVDTGAHQLRPGNGRSALVVTLSLYNPTGENQSLSSLSLYRPGTDIGQEANVSLGIDLTAQVASVPLALAYGVTVPPGASSLMVAVFEISSDLGQYEIRSSWDSALVLRLG